jgi:hypothetical protein
MELQEMWNQEILPGGQHGWESWASGREGRRGLGVPRHLQAPTEAPQHWNSMSLHPGSAFPEVPLLSVSACLSHLAFHPTSLIADSSHIFIFYLFIFLVRLEFEIRTSCYCLSHTSSPFCSGYFGDGCIVNYLPGLASNCDLPISASQVARITGVIH